MKITIIKPGLLSTIQDLGRKNYRSQAVPVSGAMDTVSAMIANKVVGNADGDAVIEFTHGGAAFFTETDVLLSLSGDGAYLNIDDVQLPSDRPIFVPAQTRLHLSNNTQGSRSYLAVAGGWDVLEVLGSRSTYITAQFGGLNGRPLVEKDQLSHTGNLSAVSQAMVSPLAGDKVNYPNWAAAQSLFLPANRKAIRVVAGREFNWFDAASAIRFFSEPFTVGNNSNRMGYHLQGTIMKRTVEGELLSTAVTAGTIQVTNNGGLILLMADCQTTGGYPRLAQVAAVDLPLCAQLKPGDSISFTGISWNEAEQLLLKQQLDLRKLSWAIGQKYLR